MTSGPPRSYEVTVTTVAARPLAACRASTDFAHLGETIMLLLDQV